VKRALEWQFDYPVSYEVVTLERIERTGDRRAYSYPAAAPVPSDQEVADGPILEVRPANGVAWTGVFYGDYGHPPAAPGRLLGWPDGVSLCVVWEGGAAVVRSDDPTATYEIEPIHPITGVFSVPERRMTLFADFTHIAGYGADGLIWTSPRLALDDLTISGVDGDVIIATGFFGGAGQEPISIDLHTGVPLLPLPLDFSNNEF
jgi:hypothetical protein